MDPVTMKEITKRAFPDYTGRKIRMATYGVPRELNSYWDSGHRDYWAFVRLADRQVLSVESNHPFFEKDRPRTLRSLPVGFALVCLTYSGQHKLVTIWEGTDMTDHVPALT